jgi:hypothetical protein
LAVVARRVRDTEVGAALVLAPHPVSVTETENSSDCAGSKLFERKNK